MPHQALQDLQRYAGIQHMHRIGMAERMWRDRDRECHTISGSGGNRFPNPGPDRSVRHFPDPRFLCPACSFITLFYGEVALKKLRRLEDKRVIVWNEILQVQSKNRFIRIDEALKKRCRCWKILRNSVTAIR